jgi:hypothetical protein
MQLLICDKKDLSEDFIRYDTAYETDHGTEYYQLPDGKLMVLFLLCEKQLFTTIRRWDWEKEIFYRNLIGKAVGIEIRYE